MGNLLINYVIDGGIGINEENFKKIAKFTRSKKIPDEKVFLIFSDFKLKDNLQKLGINYNFLEKASIFRPELRVIAKDLGAPYSLILKTYLEF